MPKTQGTVKFFDPKKGYGFIQPAAGGEDVFVHITELKSAGYDGLDKGNRVEFEAIENRGRVKATNIKLTA